MNKIKYIFLFLLVVSMITTAQWEVSTNTGLPTFQSSPEMTSGGSYLFVDGKFRSSNNGESWEEYNYAIDQFNKPTTQFYFDNKLFSGHNSSGDCILYSTDNGTTWQTPQGVPSTTSVYGFFEFIGTLFAYVPGTVYKSTDLGLNWAPKGSSMGVIVAMTSLGNDLFVTTTTGGVFKSSDNGETWTQSNNGILNSFPFNDWPGEEVWSMGGKLYFYSQSGAYYVSSDAATTWEKWTQTFVPGGTVGLRSFYKNGSHLYFRLAVFNFTLLRWEEKIFFTADEEITLVDITDNLSVTGMGEKVIEFNNYLYVAYPGTQEKFYRRNTSSFITDVEETEIIPSGFELMQNYPNPFNPSTTIKYTINTPTFGAPSREGNTRGVFVTLSVYDLLGRNAATLVNEVQSPGNYSVEFNTQNKDLSSGIYFYKLQAGSQFITKKMLLMK